MFAVASYILLENFTTTWSGWLMILPAMTDLIIVAHINHIKT